MERERIQNKFIFRAFRPEDFPAIQEIWDLTGMGSPARGDDSETILTCIRQGGHFIIMELEEEKKIVGTSWLTWDGRRTYLHHFGIHPDYQGAGLGTMLGKETLRYLKKMGSQVKLEVHKTNLIAKKLYEKLGFFSFVDYDIYMIRDLESID